MSKRRESLPSYDEKKATERAAYFSKIENEWKKKARAESLKNVIRIQDSQLHGSKQWRADLGNYDVIYIDDKGEAKRVGGIAGTDIGGGGLSFRRIIDSLGEEGPRILKENGFSGLVDEIRKHIPRYVER